MRALITNDDGVDSAGLGALAAVAYEAGLDVVVAAPSWDSSGASSSLTAVERDGRLLVEQREFPSLPEVPVYAIEAAPAFIVRAAAVGAFGPAPDVVLSGVNHGPNLGHAVLHSGTVGAALTAATFGIRSMAVSIDVGKPVYWETACAVAATALDALLAADRPLTLNVNVPNVAWRELTGFHQARLAPFGAVQTMITEQGAGYLKLGYAPVEGDAEPGTDVAVLAAGAASYTAMSACCEDLGPFRGPSLDQPGRSGVGGARNAG
jgi:5'-nucleotidase